MIFFSATLVEAAVRKEVPSRSQISSADQWDLTLLYQDEKSWEADFNKLKELFPQYAKFKGKVGCSAEDLLACLEFDKSLDLLSERLGHYVSLRTAEDGSNTANLAREGQLLSLCTQMAEAASFIAPEIQQIEEAAFETFLQTPSLKPWVHSLRRLRRFKPHTLSQAEERLMALSSLPLSGVEEAFSQLMNVDMKFGFVSDERGEEVELSNSSFSSFLQKKDPEIRRRAFHQYYQQIDGHRYTLAATFCNSIKADVFRARARNYPSAREQALFADNVPTAVYDQLIEAVHSHLPPLHRYFELRRRVLKLKEIHHYDTYVPLVQSVEKKTSFDEAIELLIAAVKPLGSEYTSVLEKGLRKERWCDRYESKGKRSGAFSSSSYGNPPFMLMNYKDDVFSDVYTLAHEAGHSMHSWYSQRWQAFQDYHYPIFLAEVASTFNEELLTHHLLETTKDPAMRAFILNRQIDDIRGTIYRQTMFAEFEKLAHAMEEEGEGLTVDSLRTVYRKLLDLYFGPNFVIDEELGLEYLRIPHFYSAFYVYKYATGLSAAIALSQRVLRGGKQELEDYMGFLKSGRSKYPLDTLQAAGVDMSRKEPIESALKLFEARVDELEKLLMV